MAFNFDIKECPNCGEWYAEHQGECPNPKCKRIADSFRQNEAVIVKKPRKQKTISNYPKEPDFADEPSFYCLIEGEPLPKERPRFSGKRAYTAKRTDDYKALVQNALNLALRGKVPSTRLISLDLEFRRKNQVEADVDNLAKAIMDAANGMLWNDDKQVRRLCVSVSYGWGENAGVALRLYEERE